MSRPGDFGTDWTHYERLGVSQDASAEEIRTAYRKHVSSLHPDRHQGPYQTHFQELAKGLNEARDTLLDPSQRAAYDSELAFQRASRAGGGTQGSGAQYRDPNSEHARRERVRREQQERDRRERAERERAGNRQAEEQRSERARAARERAARDWAEKERAREEEERVSASWAEHETVRERGHSPEGRPSCALLGLLAVAFLFLLFSVGGWS